MTGEREILTGRLGEAYVLHRDRVIGTGGFSTVYEAETVDRQPLALKVVRMPDAAAGRRYEEARRGGREIDVARRIDPTTDSHLMPITDDFPLDDEHFALVMPRAESSLASTITAHGPLGEADSKRLLADMLMGLEQLARAGVAHRDIKPANTLWWGGRWVLADFGIARILDDDTASATWANAGTQMYWAPELFDADPASPLTDLYAAGCTVFEALTAHPPFPRNRLANSHRFDPPMLPSIADPTLERVTRLLLAKDPGGRPVDARAAREMLLPAQNMSATQQRLQKLAARAAQRADNRAATARRDMARQQEQASGLARLTVIWNELAGLARNAMPDAESLIQGNSLFLTAAETRLNLTHASSGDEDLPLVIAELGVRHFDVQAPLLLANAICVQKDGRLNWQIATFSPNALHRDAPQLPHGLGNVGAALPLADAARLLKMSKKPASGVHIPPVLVQTEELTAETLLGLFVEGAEAIFPRA